MTVGLLLGAEHAGDREAVDVGVDDADRVPASGEGDGEVHRHAGLADPALAGGDEQRAGARAGLGERDRPPLGVPLGLTVGVPVAAALQLDAQGLAVLVAHHGELDGDARHARERGDGAPHPVGDLVLQRAARDGQGDEDGHVAVGGRVDRAHHAELDDGAVDLRVLDGTEGLDDLVSREGHRDPSGGGGAPFVRGGDRGGNLHYGDR